MATRKKLTKRDGLSVLQLVEKCQTRKGEQPMPDVHPYRARCCPVCRGIIETDLNVVNQIARQFVDPVGHRQTCALAALIRDFGGHPLYMPSDDLMRQHTDDRWRLMGIALVPREKSVEKTKRRRRR